MRVCKGLSKMSFKKAVKVAKIGRNEKNGRLNYRFLL
jgi:hypothetical protein